jgi:CheY-like chemotaxis protein
MLNVLIIEDDSFKYDNISEFLKSQFNKIHIDKATNLYDAMQNISKTNYELILVDMSIPSHPITPGSGSPINLLDGGIEIIVQLKLRNEFADCIIVTQYPEVESCGESYPIKDVKKALHDFLDIKIIGCIQYMDGSNEWKFEIREMLRQYENFNS